MLDKFSITRPVGEVVVSKFIVFATIFCISLLLALQLIDPAASLMLLAGRGALYMALRSAMIAALLLLLFTDQPQSLALRVVKGVLAAGLSVWTFVATYQETLKLLDSLSIWAFSICTALSAVEPTYGIKSRGGTITTIRHKLRLQLAHYSLPALLNGTHKLSSR